MAKIRTFADYEFEYYKHEFYYGRMVFQMSAHDHYYFWNVKSFKLIEGSNDLASQLLGKKYNVNVSFSDGKYTTIKCKDLATAELIMNIFREKAPKQIGNENRSTEVTTTKSKLKEKLEEILELKNQGILSEEEYELKRKQIIEKY